MEYHEALDIAKKNPGAVLTRDASGTFIVRLRDGSVIGASAGDCSIAYNLLQEEITELRGWLIEKDSIIEELRSEAKALRNDIENTISTRLESEKSRLAEIREDLSMQSSVLEQKTKNVQAHLKKLELLEKTYREKLGEVVIKTVKESVESRSVCQKCGGDGGVRGGCKTCDGSGWVLSTETTFREVGEIK